MKRFILLIALFMLGLSANAQTFQVKVIKISDGDTFSAINRDNLELKFRIYGIDAPEKKQAFGKKAKEYLSTLIFGQIITVNVQSQDSWGRYIANVYTTDKKDVSLEMLKAGMAWHYSKYDNTLEYQEAEVRARIDRRGLWIDTNRIAPWDFRK